MMAPALGFHKGATDDRSGSERPHGLRRTRTLSRHHRSGARGSELPSWCRRRARRWPPSRAPRAWCTSWGSPAWPRLGRRVHGGGGHGVASRWRTALPRIARGPHVPPETREPRPVLAGQGGHQPDAELPAVRAGDHRCREVAASRGRFGPSPRQRPRHYLWRGRCSVRKPRGLSRAAAGRSGCAASPHRPRRDAGARRSP